MPLFDGTRSYWEDREQLKRIRKEYEERCRKKAKVTIPPPPPPLPTLATELNEDVTTKVFEFLDGKALHGASMVSRSFRDALIPRQKAVKFSGFRSFESFQKMGFVGMEYFNGDRSKLMTDAVLMTLAKDSDSFPNLRCVSAKGCIPGISFSGGVEYEKIRLKTGGRRLEERLRDL